jgi:flagellar L-ring protein precursor FlgH
MIKAQLCALAAMLLAGCASSLAPPAVRPGPFDEPPQVLRSGATRGSGRAVKASEAGLSLT